MPFLDIKIGDLELRPTDNEQYCAAAGAAAVLLGLASRSRALTAVGALAIAGVAYAVYEEAQTFRDPALMNGAFKTGGQLSATRGPAEAAVLAEVLEE
jgi:uncharacterized membrane protein YebE (DUF533 family)